MIFNTISGRRRAKKILVLLVSIVVLLYLLAPIYWVVVSSFQKEIALQDRPPHYFPSAEVFTTNHYYFIFTGVIPPNSTIMLQSMYTMRGTLVYPAIINSIIIASIVTIINVVVGFPAAHIFARYRFFGDRKVFLLLLATRLLPSISIVVAMYILLLRLDLLDTKLALVGIYSAITLPFTIWILRAYFHNIPVEFEEAARLDGCRYIRMMTKVVVPLARPGLIAAAIFAFMASYGEFVFATILTQTIRSQTQTAVLASLSQGMSTSRGMIAAAATLSILPPLLLAIVFRKHILEGLTARLGL
ncbi:MAG: carbohydrate ABC transporter permease [Anaerolineae bacterium]|nr:MAG: carbohydrate ABC transporter permease [Anaerolineae bacterium]